MGRLTRALMVTPVALLAVAWLGAVAMGVLSDHPLWKTRPRSLAEAAALRDGAAIIRGIAAGADPTAPGQVRARLISSKEETVTPLEAAVRSARPEIVRLLLDAGAGADAAAWNQAWCSTDDPAVRAELAAGQPADAAMECD